MKKTYKNPSTRIVKIQIQQMIAASKVGFGASVESASGADSRGRNAIWDDEEE